MTQHKLLDDLAGELFHVFSRLEYSLKATGYNNGDGKAEANWRKFALDVEGLIANPTPKPLKDAIDFILNAPPKKQVIRNGLIKWETAEPTTNSLADKLLIYIRRVRNNLFHGGKFNGHWFDPERSEPLLRNSLVVLSCCMESAPDVREAYYG